MTGPSEFPPVTGELLAGRLQEIAGRARHNVARNRAFDVDANSLKLRPSLVNGSKNLRPYRHVLEILPLLRELSECWMGRKQRGADEADQPNAMSHFHGEPSKTTFRSWVDGGRSVFPSSVVPPFAGPRVYAVAGFI